MTRNSTGIQPPQEASQVEVAAREQQGAPVAIGANRFHSTAIEDAAMQAALQPWAEMECYQLGTGRRLAQMDSLDLGKLQVVRETQAAAVQKVGVTPRNFCTLSYCTPDPSFRFSEQGAGVADTLFFIPEHTEYDIYVPAGVQTGYISFGQEAFLSGARALNPAAWEHAPQQLLALEATQQASLKAVMNQWLEAAKTVTKSGAPLDMDVMQGNLLQNVLQIATSARQDDSRLSPAERARAFHICRMARAFVDESLAVDVVPTIVDICTAVDVSERSLQYAFRAYVSMSPLVYLRYCRLSRARATLRASDPQLTTVTSVAMRFGFLHLGRFALDYKQLFDESPSVTLAS
jgi:AraC family ethanolamine operon transcriptional activator